MEKSEMCNVGLFTWTVFKMARDFSISKGPDRGALRATIPATLPAAVPVSSYPPPDHLAALSNSLNARLSEAHPIPTLPQLFNDGALMRCKKAEEIADFCWFGGWENIFCNDSKPRRLNQRVNSEIKILLEFLERFGPEVTAHQLPEPRGDAAAKLDRFARGLSSEDEREEVCSMLRMHPAWLRWLADRVKLARGGDSLPASN